MITVQAGRSHNWDVASSAVPFGKVVAALKSEKLSEWHHTPVLGNNPDLGLFIARPHLHANPIRSKCPFTLSSSSTTRSLICGIDAS